MITVEKIKSAYHVYSSEAKPIKRKNGEVHSKYIFKEEPNIDEFVEVE